MYIVIQGGGKVASALAMTLTEKKHTVVVIERREEIAEKIAMELIGRSGLVILGDACDVAVLDEAGAGRADIFVAATGEDDENLVACQLALISFEVPRAISRVNNPKNAMIFQKLNIEAISSTLLISRMIEEEAVLGNLHTLHTLREGNIALLEIELGPNSSGVCTVSGKRVGDIKLPPDCKLVAIVRDIGTDVDIITPDTILLCNDTVIAIADPVQEEALANVLRGE